MLRDWSQKDPQLDVTCRGSGEECLLYCLTVIEKKKKEEQTCQCVGASGSRKPQNVNNERTKKSQRNMKSQLLKCLERRCAYASAIGKSNASDRAGGVEVLSNPSDIPQGIIASSADIFVVLYPLMLGGGDQHKRRMMWNCIPIRRVPAPLLLFLHEAFPNTNWNSLFSMGTLVVPRWTKLIFAWRKCELVKRWTPENLLTVLLLLILPVLLGQPLRIPCIRSSSATTNTGGSNIQAG